MLVNAAEKKLSGPGSAPLSDTLLAQAGEKAPVMARSLKIQGNQPLGDYLAGLIEPGPKGYQQVTDLAEIVERYATPLLGQEAARQARLQLERRPVILTANHHGVDFFAQSLQGTLLFATALAGADGAQSVAPVLACASVPLDNVTFPRGLLIYGGEGEIPQRLGVFSNRFRRQMVATVAGFDQTMVDSTLQQARKLGKQQGFATRTMDSLEAILEEDYRSALGAHRRYSDQAVMINSRIWPRLFAQQKPSAGLAYLEMEKIVSLLLEEDLRDRTSLASIIAFDSRVRSPLLTLLDGQRACWDMAAINAAGQGSPSPASCGTFLFWGLTAAGRRIPLAPDPGGRTLCGHDHQGQAFSVALQPQAIRDALREARLLPSLFSCFLTLALARGIVCLGGYYQADYLPTMQWKVAKALREGGWPWIAAQVAGVPTDRYLSGMQTVMSRTPAGGLLPAGAVEMTAGGGLSEAMIARGQALTLREAHLASLLETVPDVIPEAARRAEWKIPLALELGRRLRHRVAILE